MSTHRVQLRRIAFMASALVMSVAGQSFAQSDGGGTPRDSAEASALAIPAGTAHVLKQTYFQTVNDGFMNLSSTFVNAFPDTAVPCPPGGCTIAVTVMSQFGQIPSTDVAQVKVLLDGVSVPPADDCCLNLSRNAGQLPQTNGMTFVATGVHAGSRVLRVQFALKFGPTGGIADYRTLEIRVYKP